MKETLFSFFLAAWIFLSFQATGQHNLTNQRIFDTIPFLPDLYKQRVALFEKEPVVKGIVVFLGNSITQGGDWKRLLNDNTILNRGIGGDVTYGVLNRLDDITRRAPSKLFILIGINDIGKDIPVSVIADNIKKIIQQVQQHSPGTTVFLQSVLPLNPEYPGFPQHYDKNEKVLQLNPLLKKVALEGNAQFVDLFAVFQDGRNYLQYNLTNDGLHLNEKGYELWVEFLKKEGYL